MSPLFTHFVLHCHSKAIFDPKNTPLQPHKIKKTAFNRSETY